MQKKSHTPFFSPPADEKKAHCGPMTRREGDSKSWTKTKNAREEKKNLRGETIFAHKKQTKRKQTTTEPVHAEFSAVKKEVKAVSAEFFREEIKI